AGIGAVAKGHAGQGFARRRGRLACGIDPRQRAAHHDRIRPDLPARFLADSSVCCHRKATEGIAPCLRRTRWPACPVAGNGPLSRAVHRCGQDRRGRIARSNALCRSRVPGEGAMRNWLGILLLVLAWLALTGSWTIPNALLGLVLSAA